VFHDGELFHVPEDKGKNRPRREAVEKDKLQINADQILNSSVFDNSDLRINVGIECR